MRFDILTIFPDLLESPLKEGIIRRSLADGKAQVGIHNIRDYALDRHSMTDDRPFGGGEGMVMKPEPIVAALEDVRGRFGEGLVVMLSPQGDTYNQAMAAELAGQEHLVLLCGRYEGIDERVIEGYVDRQVSIGDYILTGGELAAMVMIDSIIRLLPGVLGCADSASRDTFSRGLLKHPQYTRPRIFAGCEVPEVLINGDHAKIEEWRLVAAVEKTLSRRPELLTGIVFTREEIKILKRHNLQAAIAAAKGTGSDS